MVLSASDTTSSVSSQITLGTVRLNVVGTGVVLIEGEVTNIVVQEARARALSCSTWLWLRAAGM